MCMKYFRSNPTVNVNFKQIVVTIVLLQHTSHFISCTPVTTQRLQFPCGQDVCDIGYSVCISPPLVLEEVDSYCIPCDKGPCGTAEEQVGCHLFCRDMMKNDLENAYQRIKQLDTENDKLQGKKWTDELVVSVMFNGLLLVITVCLMGIIRERGAMCRHTNHIPKDRKKDGFSSISESSPLASASSSDTSIPTSTAYTDDDKLLGIRDKEIVCNDCYGKGKLSGVNPAQKEPGAMAVGTF